MTSVLKVNVTDTFNFWREQFNSLVDSVGRKEYFITPQDFGAVGDGIVDDTDAFNAARFQSKPVLIPPGTYKLSSNIDGTNKFFNFGGVSWVGGFSASSSFSFDVVSSLVTGKPIQSPEPTLANHLATKNYVDSSVSAEAAARVSLAQDLNNNYWTKTESDSRFVNITGDTMSGFLNLHSNPTQNMHAATKQYVDSAVNTTTYNNIRSVPLPVSNGLYTVISDYILPSDINGVVNYSAAGDGWSNVQLPNLSSMVGQERNTITITNSTLTNSFELRIVPAPGQAFYPNLWNPFYPNGVVGLRRGDSVVLVPAPAGNYWWVLSTNRFSATNNMIDLGLTFSATVSSNGTLLRRRGFLGVQITKTATGVYKINWQEESVFGDYPQIYVTPWAQSPNVDVVVAPDSNISTQAIIRTFFNGTAYDLTFDMLIAYPTNNTYKPY